MEERNQTVTAEHDFLHPLATLHLELCHKWSEKVWPRHCAVLHDTTLILDNFKNKLHISSSDLCPWTTTRAPYAESSLTTYKSKFVLVGGHIPDTLTSTNELLTSTTGLNWETTLPAMPTKRSWTSSVSGGSPEVLVVAGGKSSDHDKLAVVEVLLGDHWSTVNSLPAPCWRMTSTFHEGDFYFTGGLITLYTCSCDCLTAFASNDGATTQLVWSTMRTPSRIDSIVSYSSRLISIDYKSIIRGYSNVSQTWLKPTMVDSGVRVDRLKGSGMCVSTVVSSTGQLLVINDVGVYKGTLSVLTFDPDSEFISNVLPRLHAVMEVDIASVLATKWVELTSAVRVSRPEAILYVEDLFDEWSKGYSDHAPTWRELLQVLQDIGLPELRQQIEAFMKGEASYLEAYHFFIETKESLDLLFLKFLFLGPPRLGKTTVRRRLLKEIVDLISAGEADQSQPSTGTVQSSDVVVKGGVSSTTAVITVSEWSALADLRDEAQMLIHSLMRMKNIQTSSKPSGLHEITRHDQSDTVETILSKPSQPSSVTTEIQQPLPVVDLSSATSNRHQDARLPQHISESSTILKKLVGSDHWKNIKYMFKAYMRMEDTGGQPELMDMLPALTLGPGLYLLFINLQNDLDHHYKLTYCNSCGESTPPIESVYSVREMLLSSLSSISCSNTTCSSVGKPTTSSPYAKNMLESSKSVAYIVGTHKDKSSSEHVDELNDDLKKMIKPTQFYKQDIVQFASKEDLIVAIDNMAGGAEEVEKFKKLLEDCMARHFKKLKIPAVWLFFSLFLRHHDKRTVSLDYCMQLSNSLGMSVHETEVALWFLHHHAGVLMYFPNVPELKNIVIIDVQVVYDSVTKLILQAMSYDKVGHSDAHEFTKTGKFTLSCIIAATHEVSGDHIPIDKLVILLEYLHIIARISSDDKSPPLSSSRQEDVNYMMPCVLKNATEEEFDSISKNAHEIPPMLFHFTCGAVPIGLFPALIACLIPTKSFKLIQDGLFKNIVKFRYGRWRTSVTFICHSKFYEISISTCARNVQLYEECDSIRKEVDSTLVKVSSRFNYGSLVDYQFAFDCPIHPNCNRQHLCVIDRDDHVPHMMDCLENTDNRQPVELSEHHKTWFGLIPTKRLRIASEEENSSHSSSNEDLPTLLSVIAFTCTDGETINILEEIGTDYYNFGIFLLNDKRGNKMETLEHKHMKDPLPIVREIFSLWLKEKGQPVSWQTLVNVLKNVGLIALAKKIQSQKL